MPKPQIDKWEVIVIAGLEMLLIIAKNTSKIRKQLQKKTTKRET